MLNRARYPAGDVELRRDRFAGLPDLVAVRDPTCIHRGARRADSAAERGCERFDDVEMFWSSQPTSARDDYGRLVHSDRTGFKQARHAAPLITGLMRVAAARLWKDDLAYAERRYQLRAGTP